MDKRNGYDKNKKNSQTQRNYDQFEHPPSYYRNNPGARNRDNSRHSADGNAGRVTGRQEPYDALDSGDGNVVPIESRIKRTKPSGGRRASRSDVVVLAICLILFTLSVGGSLFKFLTKEQVATMVVPYGSVDIPRVMKGIIIRDETLYYASADGEVVYNVADGEKVRKGAMVCSIEDGSGAGALHEQSQQLSQKIIEMQNMRGDISAVASDVNLINNKIKSEIDASLLKISSGDTASLYTLKETLNKNIKLRNEKLLNENSGAVKAYVDEYRQYAGKIEESRAPVVAGEGGVVSYTVDGYEDVLTFAGRNEITKEQTTMSVEADAFVQAKDVKQEDPVFKIIESNEWYIASYIENDLIHEWSEGGSCKLYIEKNGEYIEHTFKIHTIRKGEPESYVLLKSDKQILDFLDVRTVSFKTYDSVHSGIKVPESAICERTFLKIPAAYVSEDGRNNTVVQKKNGEYMEQVKINAKTIRTVNYEEGFVYIMQDFDNIRRGDTIVLDGTDEKGYVIDEIVPSQGVFRTNTGLATFVSINTEGMVKGNKGYVILDANLNNGGVKLYDRIVTDVVSNYIKEGDIIN